MSLLLDWCMPRRRRERRRELQPPLSEGQPPHAARSQPGGQRCREGQRNHLRNCVSPHSTAPRAPTNHRGDCPPTVSLNLVDPAPGSPLRRTRPSSHQTIEAKAHCQNDSATPKPRLSDRTTESSPEPYGRAVIFDPVGFFHPLQHAGCSENKEGDVSRLHRGYLYQPRLEPRGLGGGDI